MPDNLTNALVTAVATAALGGVATWIALYTRIRADLEAQYDRDLRDRRLAAYKTLWALTEPLAKYSPPGPLSGHRARLLSEALRSWYFRDGIVLSTRARDAYFHLQKLLTAKPLAAALAQTGKLDTRIVELLQEASHELRTALSGDVASRRPPMIVSDNDER